LSNGDPVTNLHYAPNDNFVESNGVETYAPGVDGFNLADVSSLAELNALPAGVEGLVYLNMTDGVTAAFEAAVDQYIGDPKLYGFYVADQPTTVPAATIKAEADYIHANVPGAITFMWIENTSTPTSPVYNLYNPQNTDIDLFGISPQPIRAQFSGGMDYSVIPDAVNAAVAGGIPLADIVPIYQAFGGGGVASEYTLPSASQEEQILSTWGTYVPTPAFDFAYSWGVQDDNAISNEPSLQAVFAAYNAQSASTPPAPTITSPANGSTDTTTATPAISGTGVTGDTVTVSIDGTVVDAAPVVNGAWSFTPTSALSNASHTITATQAAAGGSSSTAASDTFTVNVGTAPAAPTITSPAKGSTDTTTATPTISGGGVTGDTVTVSIDGTVVGAAPVVSGAWSFTPTSALSNASHTITATQAAAGGPSSAAASDTFTVNVTTAPAAPTITSPANNSTDTTTATPTISGGGVTGDTVTVSIDGSVAGTALVVSSAWSFTPTSALSNASHTITATQAAAGGPSSTAASDTFTVNVATAPAAPTITSPANGSTDTATATPTVSGGGVTGDTVTVSIDGTVAGTAPVVSGAWSFTPTSALSNASHTLSATQAAPGGASSAAATDTFTVNVAGQTISTASGNLYLASTSNPLTITSTGSVTSTSSSDAIDAPSGTAWQINNAGTISGVIGTSSAGIYSPASGITVQNTGKIAGSVGGLWLTDGGSVTNGAAGVISSTGSYGIYVSGAAGSITNLGTITGASYAVDLTFSSASNQVVVAPGAVFTGLVSGGNGTLELAAGSGAAGTLSGTIGGTSGGFQNFSQLVIDAGASWSLSGALQITTIQLGGSLEVASDTTPSSQINFASGAKLTIDNAASFAGPLLSNFTAGDTIDIKSFSVAGATLSYNSSTGVAQISNGSQTATLDFKTSTLGAGALQVASDGGTGVVLALSQAPPPAAPTITSPANGSTDTTTTTPTISGTGVAGDIVSLSIDGGTPVSATVQAGGGWSYTPTSPLSNASHTVSATQAAASGGASSAAATDTFTVNVAGVPAAPTIASPANGSTDTTTTTPTISGTGVAGDIVSLSIDGGAPATTTVQTGGGWSYTLTSPLSNASHTVSATQAAPGGQSSVAATDTFTVNVSGLTISSATTGPLTLAAGNNPVTITSAGSVTTTASGADAIDGAAGTNWSITNAGTISSSQSYGVSFKGSGGTIVNSGTISGYSGSSGYGVDFEDGGTITNTSTGAISGGEDAIFVYAAAGTINNSGTISSSFDDGIGLFAGGSVVNNAGGVIKTPTSGGFGPAAIYIPSGSASVVNHGSISGQYGVYYQVAGTVENAGTISGTSYAVDFTASSSANKLIVDPGAVFNGNVNGGGGSMELTAGTGSIGLIGSSAFSNFTTLTDDAGGAWTLTGANTIANVTDNGALSVNGSLDVTSALNSASTGAFDLGAGGVLEVASATGAQTAMDFLGASQLVVDNAALFGTGVGGTSYLGSQLENFGTGDSIDLHNFSASGATFAYNSSSGLLQLSSGGALATLDFQQSTLGGGSFHLGADASGSGLLVTRA
jgi:Bacterial Ig-like domain